MNKLSIPFIVIFVLVSHCFVLGDGTPHNEPTYDSPSLNNATRNEKWKSDLTWLRDTLPKKHINLFFCITEKEYYTRMNKLIQNISQKNDSELIMELQSIFCSIANIHGGIYRGLDNRKFSIEFFFFEDGCFVTGIDGRYEKFCGKKLIAIEGIPIKECTKKLLPYVYRGRNNLNPFLAKEYMAEVLNNALFLYGTGIIKSENEVTYKFENGELTLSVDKYGWKKRYADWKYGQYSLRYEKLDENFWYKRNNNIMYIKINRCVHTGGDAFCQEVFREIDMKKVQKIVIDLRGNPGGFKEFISSFIDEIKKRPNLNTPENLKVIAGRDTGSSASVSCGRFDRETNAMVIGEPCYIDCAGFGWGGYLNLTNVNLLIHYSIEQFLNPIGNANPYNFFDVIIPLKAKEYFEGRDVFLEKVGVYQNSPQNSQDSKQNKKPEKLKANIKKPEKLDNPFLERKLTDNPF